jgi:hypothetical protein
VPVAFVLTNAALLAGMALGAAGGASRWFASAAALWLVVASAYIAAILAASVLTARRYGWATLPILPAVFATYHFSYGLGFSAGLLRFFTRRGPVGSAFTRISR